MQSSSGLLKIITQFQLHLKTFMIGYQEEPINPLFIEYQQEWFPVEEELEDSKRKKL